jgi:hypothetical protein
MNQFKYLAFICLYRSSVTYCTELFLSSAYLSLYMKKFPDAYIVVMFAYIVDIYWNNVHVNRNMYIVFVSVLFTHYMHHHHHLA